MEMRGSSPYRPCALGVATKTSYFSRIPRDDHLSLHCPRFSPRLRCRPPPLSIPVLKHKPDKTLSSLSQVSTDSFAHSGGPVKSRHCHGVRLMILGQAAAALQVLQSRKSGQRLFFIQHLMASRVLAPDFDQRHPARLNRLPTICLQALSTTPEPTGNPRLRQRSQRIRSALAS